MFIKTFIAYHRLNRVQRTLLWSGGAFGLLLLFILVAYLYVIVTLPDVDELKSKNPQKTALMELRLKQAAEQGKKLRIRQYWVPFRRIPKLMRQAVRITEDASFYKHHGIDTDELWNAMKTNWMRGKYARGASTITQQLAKNLYLSTEKSIWRKVREYFIARELETNLSKNRIFHLYLNVIEWGPGVFGVEAAARYYFGVSVHQLTPSQMIRLTAIIPRPLTLDPRSRNSRLLWKCRWILRKLKLYGYITTKQYTTWLKNFQ
ncbi:MAG: monofunctional biosynthetic peptidoglycan transglycosylase [Calditrichaeota bacterium]|nr:MAG: monofunctional biosynthetic peptidoglycan transglycosylase [Calditrichota bacterium]